MLKKTSFKCYRCGQPEHTDFEKPTYDILLEICAENWEGNEKHPHEEECLKFYTHGRIEKTIDGMIISRNDKVSDLEKEKVANQVNVFYDELQTEPYRNWLLEFRLPFSGGISQTITTYAKSKKVHSQSQRLVTTYMWGNDYSKEAQRLIEIFDTLESFTYSVNTPVEYK